jgi:hypothetical protein
MELQRCAAMVEGPAGEHLGRACQILDELVDDVRRTALGLPADEVADAVVAATVAAWFSRSPSGR